MPYNTAPFRTYVIYDLNRAGLNVGLELAERLENPCDHTEPMSPELTKELYRIINDDDAALEFIQILQDYVNLTIPRLTPRQRLVWRRIIHPKFYLQFLRVFDRECSEPPVLSDYCVQWSNFAMTPFFPCADGSEINGNTSQGELCAGAFDIADFQATGNQFRYSNISADWYVQVIRPRTNDALTDFGTYSFDVFGNPSGPVPIEVQNENCVLNCQTMTFDVTNPDTDGIWAFVLNEQYIDLASFLGPIPTFGDPTINEILYDVLVGWFEPTATISVEVGGESGTTITITIQSILTFTSIFWGPAVGQGPTEEEIFTPCP